MPTWGLTSEQVRQRPWDIPEDYLKPAKTLTDPIHGDIYLTKLELMLVDSPPMQRLRRVRQLGMTHLVYPSATHTRYSHSLGTLRCAQDLLDAVWASRTSPQARELPDNLLAQWYDDDGGEGVELSQHFARATVLARLGALLHDLCHVPIGHTIEDDLGVLISHDHNEERLKTLWAEMDAEAREVIERDPELWPNLQVLIISKTDEAKEFLKKESAYPFVADIVGNTICADLMDYIRRDHHNTGLPLALGHRFLDSFYVTSRFHPVFPSRMVIGIERDGRLRNDVVTELVKFLRYRYELTERVLTHHAKTAADAMLGKMLGLWDEHIWLTQAVKQNSSIYPPDTRLNRLNVTTVTERIDRGHSGSGRKPSEKVRAAVQKELEREFLRFSDDGLLEYLRDLDSAGSRRLRGVSRLATMLLKRDVYKELGHAASPSDRAVAQEVYDKFGDDPLKRRDLERRAARYVGLNPDSEVAIWMPNPEMRLKVARVLVHKDGMVAPLSEVESTSEEIVRQHRNLWSVSVYAPSEVRDEQGQRTLQALLAFLRDETGLAFRLPNGRRVPGRHELAAEWVERKLNRKRVTKTQLMKLDTAAMDPGGETFDSLVERITQAAYDEKLLRAPRRKTAQT